MCEPATIMLAVSTVLTIAGGAMEASAQAKAGAYQAQVAQNQAKMVMDRALVEEGNVREKTQQQIAMQRAKYAASGIDPNMGSPVDVAASTAILGELDALTIRTNALNEAQGLRDQGVASKQLGKMQAFSTMLGTAGQVAGTWASFGQTQGAGAGAKTTTGSGMPGMGMGR